MVKIILLLLTLGTVVFANGDVSVQGIRYVTETETGIRFARFREDVLQLPRAELGLNPDKARNTSGGIVSFSTDATEITVRFKILSANYMGAGFGVFENGELIKEFKFTPKQTEATLQFESTFKGNSRFEIALPSFADVLFQGLETDDEKVPIIGKIQQAAAQLVAAPFGHCPAAQRRSPSRYASSPTIGKPIYVALGDSISAGVGQDGYGHKTWPFLLSRKLNMELFNLAVGGAKISVPAAEMLADWERIDLITILIGYNDLHFDGKTPEQYRRKYEELLDAIRKNHPDTKIICITPLYTKNPVSEKTGYTVDEFRKVLEELVADRNDPNLILIKGEEVSSEQNLRTDNPNDPVHPGIEGAALLADELFESINTH